MTDSTDRRLVAILSADVYGYSRLMSSQEEETFKRLTSSRELIFRLVQTHEGRVANTAGDAVLAEFPSVTSAVEAAAEIQSSIAQSNESAPEELRMHFRNRYQPRRRIRARW